MTDATTSSFTASNDTPSQCAACAKSANETALKSCAKCRSTQYCSRECQKNDWKNHKKICSQNAAARSTTNPSAAGSETSGTDTRSSASRGLKAPIEKPFHALNDKKYLHGRPETDVFKLLIDCYRFRMEDNYQMAQPDADSLYMGAPNGVAGFQRFLRKAERVNSLLPDWWSSEKVAECLRFGQSEEWSDLRCVIEKSDLLEHYGDSNLPMQLRMLGEQVYGSGPGGQSGATMLRMQMMAEGGGMHSTTLDASRFMR